MTRAARLIAPAWGLKQQKHTTYAAIMLTVFDMAHVTMPRRNLSSFSLVPIPLT